MGKFWILPASALMIAAFLLGPGPATPASATSPNGPTITPVVKTTATTAPATTATATAPAVATGTGQPTMNSPRASGAIPAFDSSPATFT